MFSVVSVQGGEWKALSGCCLSGVLRFLSTMMGSTLLHVCLDSGKRQMYHIHKDSSLGFSAARVPEANARHSLQTFSLENFLGAPSTAWYRQLQVASGSLLGVTVVGGRKSFPAALSQVADRVLASRVEEAVPSGSKPWIMLVVHSLQCVYCYPGPSGLLHQTPRLVCLPAATNYRHYTHSHSPHQSSCFPHLDTARLQTSQALNCLPHAQGNLALEQFHLSTCPFATVSCHPMGCCPHPHIRSLTYRLPPPVLDNIKPAACYGNVPLLYPEFHSWAASSWPLPASKYSLMGSRPDLCCLLVQQDTVSQVTLATLHNLPPPTPKSSPASKDPGPALGHGSVSLTVTSHMAGKH